MKPGNDRQQRGIAALLGIIPTVWLALLVAPALGGGLPAILAQLTVGLEQPFHITWTQDTPRCVLLQTVKKGIHPLYEGWIFLYNKGKGCVWGVKRWRAESRISGKRPW